MAARTRTQIQRQRNVCDIFVVHKPNTMAAEIQHDDYTVPATVVTRLSRFSHHSL
jgi:hypothetical protein